MCVLCAREFCDQPRGDKTADLGRGAGRPMNDSVAATGHIHLRVTLARNFQRKRLTFNQTKIMKNFEITQYAATTHTNPKIIFQICGPDLIECRKRADESRKATAAQGIVILNSLYSEKEILPRTLENIAAGQGKAARKARKHLRAGKNPQAQVSCITGRWE